MRMSSIGFLIAGVLLVGAAAPLRAQSLADVAKKEEERRRHTKTGKVYTNTDLGPVKAPAGDSSSSPSPSPSADTGAASGSTDSKSASDAKADEKKTDEHGQPYWAKRMASLRETLQRDTVYADALQTRINSLTTDFVNRDDPAQRAQIGAQREAAVTELNRLKKQVEDDKKAISDAEDEGRRSGVPAGWLR